MSTTAERMKAFTAYVGTLEGDEKSEAQVFCERLFQAFGHKGYKEAGAKLEERVRAKGSATKYADLVWPKRVLIEMKKRKTKLDQTLPQVVEYWFKLADRRPRYIILCNFEEFWVYDFDRQVDQPMDKVALADLPYRYDALAFLFPENRAPRFQNDLVAVTSSAAKQVAGVFNSMIKRGIPRDVAQRFVLQCVVCLFSEDAELLPKGFFSDLLDECRQGQNSYAVLGTLFRQMDSKTPALDDRYRRVPYFNGGLFSTVDPVGLTDVELIWLSKAASERWTDVQPQIFGTLFQSSMDTKDRHLFGAHFTSETDVLKIVIPTIVAPWERKIEAAKTLTDLIRIREELLQFRVLDPACGSGNFLAVAYRSLKRIETTILQRIHGSYTGSKARSLGVQSMLSLKQFFGIDNNEFAVELAKVTLTIAKELALSEAQDCFDLDQTDLPLHAEDPLPLDDLNANILLRDALFDPWPEADAIIGNPPYQSKNKAQSEYGAAYLRRVREQYPEVSGKSDYCVYWFRRAHDELKPGGRAGLIGTNSITQSEARKGGLRYIVLNGGTITDAVQSQVWSGDAKVHVSIVNWVKGTSDETKHLYWQIGSRKTGEWRSEEVEHISASLSFGLDLREALTLNANKDPKVRFQGQTHGDEGFLVSLETARKWIADDPKCADVLFPFLVYEDIADRKPPTPSRCVIDFSGLDVTAAAGYKQPFEHVRKRVLPKRQASAKEEEDRNNQLPDPKKGNRHHAGFLRKWWQFSYDRKPLMDRIAGLDRYIVLGRVGQRALVEFVSPDIHPNDALVVFPLTDDYSFGVLQSALHFEWATHTGSSFKADPRYLDVAFDSFPWPQNPTHRQVKRVATAAVELRRLRSLVMSQNDWSMREVFNHILTPGQSPIIYAFEELESAVKDCYGMPENARSNEFLFELNASLSEAEKEGKAVIGPGLPPDLAGSASFVSTDKMIFSLNSC